MLIIAKKISIIFLGLCPRPQPRYCIPQSHSTLTHHVPSPSNIQCGFSFFLWGQKYFLIRYTKKEIDGWCLIFSIMFGHLINKNEIYNFWLFHCNVIKTEDGWIHQAHFIVLKSRKGKMANLWPWSSWWLWKLQHNWKHHAFEV